ncbi:MAG: hypothetical protein Q8P68_03945 [Candidatus Peregrinibacteria bacterium]|nr:hypothetical protein [Candidatus Peregrinibacteria bacterium]MDZ4245313.1 hypothetical protein [Candidatus Gracilibacteria bacterium]
MVLINQKCVVCHADFEITQQDQAYYAKREVPLPTLCPKDRLRKRLQFRNERKLYKRKCNLTDKYIISNVKPDAPFPVYHTDEWHKQNFEIPFLESYDFNRSFFDQYYELWLKAPRMHMALAGSLENTEYANHCGHSRNCYFIFNSEDDEDCMYCRFADKCKDCVDCTNTLKSELCYECVNVKHCYNVKFSDDCDNCSDSMFLRNCRGVRNSMFCYGLERQEYCFFNQQLTKEEYEQKLKEYRVDSYKSLEYLKKSWKEWSSSFPKIRHIILNSENCSGDSLYDSQNAFDCYSATELQDCRYVMNARDVKDTYDFYAYGMETELCYECVTIAHCYDLKFCNYVMYSNSLQYCDNCWNCKNCFGCIGLRGGEFCIFNKKYSEKEYFELVGRIIESMKKEGEYGEFFPEKFSLFPYEDTLAQDYFPMETSEKAIINSDDFMSAETIPDLISDIDLSLAENTYFCSIEKKPFKFQKKELEFYKKIGVSVPRVSFEPRYLKRNELIPFPY